ncbi:hypothetical protein RvVAT039_pl08820 (plasmid) [Agrobacterium vitis]|nr:hypothetical protein RvVAR0630_pl03780 [Agrobacterium vitis]BCH68049.1 hypothetical protein RvVAT039_pl08820 [Agrobacterium vitis]
MLMTCAAKPIRELLKTVQDWLDLLKEQNTILREINAARRPHEQLRPERLFKETDMTTERRR